MAFENLSEREKIILSHLIEFYISTADPVGSRAIANKYKMGISSATIRNTLQDLEELGLVAQPHTSAGRVPTDLGYRVYVDYLLKPEVLSEEEKRLIKQNLLREGKGINEILGQTCRLLSDITQQLGVSISPKFEAGVLKRINLIPLTEERLMVVVVVKSGLARSMILEVEATISESDLAEVESVLNERLTGLTLGQIKNSISERLADVSGHGKLIKLFVDSTDKIWTESQAGDIHISGADHLLQKPEFHGREQVSELLRVIEDGKLLSEFIRKAIREGLVITIGQESRIKEIINCSMVTSQYRVGNVTGTIGIVGPTRMEYSKLVSVVDYTARTLTEVLSGISPEKEEKK